jgi:hypothetical protein
VLTHAEPVDEHDHPTPVIQRTGEQLGQPLAVAVTNRRETADLDAPLACSATSR